MNPILWVNEKKLIKNFNIIKGKTSSAFICPMIKANAYGVGDSLVAGVLLNAGAKHFGVARFEEGEKLRRFFPNQEFEILVFNALSGASVKASVESNLSLVVGSWDDLKVLSAFSRTDLKKIKGLHLKFDLGMSRFGLSLSDAAQVFGKVRNLGLPVTGVCGHFATSEDLSSDSGVSSKLLKSLVECAQGLGVPENLVHAPNSAAIERGDFNVGLRPGIGLYGVSQYSENHLEGVLRLTAPLISVSSIKAGNRVSYGGTWVVEEDTNIGILPIGYADGLRRGLSNRIRFVQNGQDYSQVGVICMDYCMVNLGSATQLKKGDDLVLFDETYSDLFKWADVLETIPYELITGLGDRIERKVF